MIFDVESALGDLIRKSDKANQAMRDYNRGGIEWEELDRIFAELEVSIKQAKDVHPDFGRAWSS